MRERFSHRGRDLVIRPIGVLLAYECLFEATHGPIQIARGAPALTGRHLTESRDLSLSCLGSMVHPSESIVSSRKLKGGSRSRPRERSNRGARSSGERRHPGRVSTTLYYRAGRPSRRSSSYSATTVPVALAGNAKPSTSATREPSWQPVTSRSAVQV